jgi:hypothetical protein
VIPTLLAWLALSWSADCRYTARDLSWPGYHETNPLLGRHPSPARIALTSAAGFGAVAAGVHRWGKKHHTLAVAGLAAAATIETGFAVYAGTRRRQ